MLVATGEAITMNRPDINPCIVRAVSSPKCNELMIVLLEVERFRHEHLDGRA